jgi:hypothetical protein
MPSEPDDLAPGDAELEDEIVEALRRWLRDFPAHPCALASHAPSCAIESSIDAQHTAFLALVSGPEGPKLVADLGSGITTAPRDLLRALDLASGASTAEVEPEPCGREKAMVAIARWCDAGAAARSLGAISDSRESTAVSSASRRAALARLARIGAALPRQARASAAPVIDCLRAVIARPLPLGAEHVLGAIVDSPLDDRAWLQAMTGFAQAHAPQSETGTPATAAPPFTLIALILFQPTTR